MASILDIANLDRQVSRAAFDFGWPGLKACAYERFDRHSVTIVVGNRRWERDHWELVVANGKGLIPWVYDIGAEIRAELDTVKEDRDY